MKASFTKLLTVLCTTLALPLLSVTASPSSSLFQKSTHAPRDGIGGGIPHGWKYVARAPSSAPLRLRIALPQEQASTGALEELLYAISTPEHSSGLYGKHLSKSELVELIRPPRETSDAVRTWLEDEHELVEGDDWESNDSGDWVTLKGVQVAKVEEMLGCKFGVYRHLDSGESVIRTTSYGVPWHMDRHIESIQPTTLFARPRAHRSHIIDDSLIPGPPAQSLPLPSAPKAPSLPSLPFGPGSGSGYGYGNPPPPPSLPALNISCNATITPTCLEVLYGYAGYEPSARTGLRLGVAGYLEEYANYQDLQTFYAGYYPKALGSSFTTKSINGGLNNQSFAAAGGEANLDIQYTGSVVYPVPITYYTTGGSPPFIPDELTGSVNSNEPYADFLEALGREESLPGVVSTSYGDDEQTVPRDYATRVCNTFGQLSLRGVSFIFSSGDGGVAGSQTPEYCASNDGKNTTKFIPTFPASCPYVTSVGALRYVEPEIGVSFSSGGFSEYFSVPAFQKEATAKYISKLPKGTYKGLYNPAGRGIPDVSAQGVRYHVVVGNATGLESGTSAAAPTFSGVITLLNDYRLRHGKSKLGWLNPWLYSVGYEGLTDIVAGSNPGCGTGGFNATEGWDPITGLGSPYFPKLVKLI